MPTRTGTRTLDYYASGQIQQIHDEESTATFLYDPFGAVQETEIQGSTDDNRKDRHFGSLITVREITTRAGSSSTIFRAIPGPGGLVASLRGTRWDWVFSFGESKGLRFTTDLDGNMLQDVGYEPYGESSSTGEQPGSDLYSSDQWNGGDALAAFGLSHLGARVYDPVIGRFLSRDPLTIARTASTSNPYAFAANDPVNLSDPSGLDWGGGCFGAECQNLGLTWSFSFHWGGGGGGGATAGDFPNPWFTGGDEAPTPAPSPSASLPPAYQDWLDGVRTRASWPEFSSPSLGRQFTQGLGRGARAFGRGWMTVTNGIDRGLNAGLDFVEDNAAPMAVGAVMGAIAAADPATLIPDALNVANAGTSSFFALFASEEPALADGAEEATTIEEVSGLKSGVPGRDFVPNPNAGRYVRPSAAGPTAAQRAAVQGLPCVDCGDITPKQFADHIDPLIVEHFRTGTINVARQSSLGAVQAHCPDCSAIQGGQLGAFGRRMRDILGL